MLVRRHSLHEFEQQLQSSTVRGGQKQTQELVRVHGRLDAFERQLRSLAIWDGSDVLHVSLVIPQVSRPNAFPMWVNGCLDSQIVEVAGVIIRVCWLIQGQIDVSSSLDKRSKDSLFEEQDRIDSLYEQTFAD